MIKTFFFSFLGLLLLTGTLSAFDASTQHALASFAKVGMEGKGKANWDEYYQNTINASNPHLTTKLAHQYFALEAEQVRLAVDLGTGTGRDALFLLKNGWRVLAMDAEEQAIRILLNRAADAKLTGLETMVATFAEMVLPDNIDLINANYSLPFCHPQDFSQCWGNIVDHLALGGRFSGNFFGERDAWADNPEYTFLTEAQVRALFKDRFEIEYFQIDEGNLPTAAGTMKHWHVFHVIAKKIR
jgi:SAM-dependent methyltransferase